LLNRPEMEFQGGISGKRAHLKCSLRLLLSLHSFYLITQHIQLMKITEISPIDSTKLSPPIKQFLTAGILLGLGFGGFFDGIILHQILQWHHMLTNVRPMISMQDVKVNSTADGLFHLMDYGFTIAGVILLWRTHQQTTMPKSAKPFIGSILVGAGLFNLIEGIIDHHILGIHYVRSGVHHLLWDIAFLASGAILIVIGSVLIDRWKTAEKSITG
jgi:uncharacterized membrane protein